MQIGNQVSGIDLRVQHSLVRQLGELSLSSIRLATMRRINKGSDDPAALVAIGHLQSELEAVKQASYNASRAVGTVHVADAAMAEAGNLLREIRGHVVSAANGSLSEAEVAAKQIEIDAALDAINRLGSLTAFGGRKLLDGQGGFQVSGVNPDQVADVQVYANAGGGQQTPQIEVTQAATHATLTYDNPQGALQEDVTLQLSGDRGTVVLQFASGATLEQIAQAVDAAAENTGVNATVAGNQLTLSSTAVGSDATVAVEVTQGTFDVGQANVAHGTDVLVSVDGQTHTGEGNTVRISTESLQADIEFAEGFAGQVDPITISGSALTFLFSPEVSQTSILSLPTVSTSALGGSAGRLGELASGGAADLASGRLDRAVAILDNAQAQLVEGRARAGAFEKYTIESSHRVLGRVEESLSSALSLMADTDVAAEASRLVRSQILVNSALSALMVAGQRRSLIAGLIESAGSG